LSVEQRNQVLRADVAAGRFLSDLRALRTAAGLDHCQLAARAHYPRDVISRAEAGPYLPALPVLAAYVRGCGGTGDEILAWEDRWRSVTGAKAHPLLAARVAGLSGANRPLSPENSDPVAISSALRRFGSRMSQPGPEPSPGAPREAPAEAPRDEPREPRESREPLGDKSRPASSVPPPAPASAPSPAPASASSSSPTGQGTPAMSAAGRGQHGHRDGGRMSAATITIVAIIAVLVIGLIVVIAL